MSFSDSHSKEDIAWQRNGAHVKKRDRRRGAEGQSIRKDGREIINANASQKPDRLELLEVTAVFGGC